MIARMSMVSRSVAREISCVRLTNASGIDEPKNACGVDSDCINRLTQVECLPDDCRCGLHCQNQR